MASNNYSNEFKAIEKLRKKRDYISMYEKLLYVIIDLKESETLKDNDEVYEKVKSHVDFCFTFDLHVFANGPFCGPGFA